jgi:hypothetical protein
MDNFYSSLPVIDNFSGIASLDNYTPMPESWHVVIADVKGSTVAIQNGEYKAVNMIGVSVITSILNAIKPENIPYIFGGDGATLCVPGSLVPLVKDALLTTQHMAESQFNLDLRVGIVPVSNIYEAGHDVLVARHKVSEYYIQAAFAGDGLDYAESIIKNDSVETPYRLEPTNDLKEADYTGLECRWDNVPSQHGETISLIVKVLANSLKDKSRIYNEIIAMVNEIYGGEEKSRPLYLQGMATTLNSKKLKYEFKARTCFTSALGKLFYWIFLRVQVSMGKLVMKFNLKTGDIDWSRYKTDAVKNADYRKFDGILREVLSGTEHQRNKLKEYLQSRHDNNECVYGIHVSDSALITCLINNRTGGHFHFVDGADGGYAMAARLMKNQLSKVNA